MTKAKVELKKALVAFDWYYNYSDDGHVWREGKARHDQLQAELNRLECPFKWWEIHHALYGQIAENCIQVGPNEYRGKAWANDSHIASWQASDIITQNLADEILAWFND